MRFWHSPWSDEEEAALKREFGVEAVYDATEPLLYTRLTARFRLTWRRELATLAVVFALGVALGFRLARA
jgi:hypothetical protein